MRRDWGQKASTLLGDESILLITAVEAWCRLRLQDLGTAISLEIQSILHLVQKAGMLTVPYNKFEFSML